MDTHAAQRLVRLNPQLLRVSVGALARPGAATLAAMLGLQPDELRRLVARCNDGAATLPPMHRFAQYVLASSLQLLLSRRLHALHGSMHGKSYRVLSCLQPQRCLQDVAAS